MAVVVVVVLMLMLAARPDASPLCIQIEDVFLTAFAFDRIVFAFPPDCQLKI